MSFAATTFGPKLVWIETSGQSNSLFRVGTPRAAEFFAGIGLMRLGLADAQIDTVWANDIDAKKASLYEANFGRDEFELSDIRDVRGDDLPDVDIATASFPCTDLSLAGSRNGLGFTGAPRGSRGESSMFWEFARVIREMGSRKPPVLLLENVIGFASSRGGRDLLNVVAELNGLGYSCDLIELNAKHFVPQSRPRIFIVGLMDGSKHHSSDYLGSHRRWSARLLALDPSLRLHAWELPDLPAGPKTMEGIVEALPDTAKDWWEADRVAGLLGSLSAIQRARVEKLQQLGGEHWRTAYRRTRNGRPVWEVRADGIAGCLRAARGGSSRQAILRIKHDSVQVRWLSRVECARLMGAPEYRADCPDSQVLFGFGDAVCVPAVSWLAQAYLNPALATCESARAPAGF
jgi:DNA (cytosine-5)-methyltransferase 1